MFRRLPITITILYSPAAGCVLLLSFVLGVIGAVDWSVSWPVHGVPQWGEWRHDGKSSQSGNLGELTSEHMGTEISLNSEMAVDVYRDAGRHSGAVWPAAKKGAAHPGNVRSIIERNHVYFIPETRKIAEFLRSAVVLFCGIILIREKIEDTSQVPARVDP